MRRDTRPRPGRRRRELYVLALVIALTKGCTENFEGLEPFEDDRDASASSGTGAGAQDAPHSNGGAAGSGDSDSSSMGDSGGNSGTASSETGSTVDGSGSGGEDAGSDGDAVDGEMGSDGDATDGDTGSDGDATDGVAGSGGRPPLTTTPLQTIPRPAGDRASFGRSLAMSNDWALVATTEEGPAGIVYAVRRDATRRWSIAQKLTVVAAPNADGQFGFSMDMDGDAAIVGDPRVVTAPDVETGPGEVHFLARSHDDVWRLAQPPSTRPSPQDGDGFGYQVAMDGAAAAVMVPEQGNVRGTIFTYRYAQGTWLGRDELTLPVTVTPPSFGNDLEIDGSTLVACAPGAAHTFDWTGDAWIHGQKLEPEPVDQHFCGSLALQGDTLLIGQPFGHIVRVFRRVAGAWKASETIVTAPEHAHRIWRFGAPVRLCGDVASVGSAAGTGIQASVTFLRSTTNGFQPFGFSWDVIPDLYHVNLACSGRSIVILDVLAASGSPGAAYFFDLLD
jgi:hypothetical protein